MLKEQDTRIWIRAIDGSNMERDSSLESGNCIRYICSFNTFQIPLKRDISILIRSIFWTIYSLDVNVYLER